MPWSRLHSVSTGVAREQGRLHARCNVPARGVSTGAVLDKVVFMPVVVVQPVEIPQVLFLNEVVFMPAVVVQTVEIPLYSSWTRSCSRPLW